MRKLNESDVNFIRYGKITPLNESKLPEISEPDDFIEYAEKLKLSVGSIRNKNIISYSFEIKVNNINIVIGTKSFNEGNVLLSYVCLAKDFDEDFDEDYGDYLEIIDGDDEYETYEIIRQLAKNQKEFDALVYCWHNYSDLIDKSRIFN